MHLESDLSHFSVDDFLRPFEMQAFVKSAGAICKKIQDGVFDA
jgi:hypothetical protein